MSHTAPTGNQPLPEPERLWLRNKAPLLQRHWHEVRTQMTGWGDPLLFGSRNGGRVCREKLGIGSPAAPLSLGKVARPHVGGGRRKHWQGLPEPHQGQVGPSFTKHPTTRGDTNVMGAWMKGARGAAVTNTIEWPTGKAVAFTSNDDNRKIRREAPFWGKTY